MTDKWHRFIKIGPILQQVLGWHDIRVDLTENLDDLKPGALEGYPILINCSTRREADAELVRGVIKHVEAGGAHIAIHGSAATFESTPEYLDMLGAQFVRHPEPAVMRIQVTDASHPITQGLPGEFDFFDEPYILDIRSEFHLLLKAEHNGTELPVAWTKQVGEGRLFCLALGHDVEQWRHPFFQFLLVRGVQWAAGLPPTF